MAINQDFVDYLVDQLSGLGGVYTKRMFGGVGFFKDGRMFGMIADDLFRLKADAASQSDFEQAGMSPFAPYGDHRTMPYWEVPADVLEDAFLLCVWATKAHEAALRTKMK